LCAALCPTVVSCRGHSPDGYEPWSQYPVVIFCADEARARLVSEAAEAASCGLAYDSGVQLLDVWAPNVTDMLTFARELLSRRATFDALPVPDGLAEWRTGQSYST
jgi:hypothetical protein